jgi:hypothetical protein
MRIEQCHLFQQLVGQPHVIGIEHGQELAARPANPEVARRGDAPVGVTRMLQIDHASRIERGMAAGDGGAAIG